MAEFALYTYAFRDVERIGLYLGQEDDHDKLPTLQDKQDFMQKIFRDDINGGREFECFRTQEFKDTKTKKNRKEKVKYGSKVVWEKSGLILLMINNPYRTITKHKDFQKIKEQDEPWCYVIIDNRFGREFIAIQKSMAFNDTDTVAEILESSLRSRFTPHYVTIDVKNQYKPEAFWDIINKHKLYGIQEVSFRFAAPNHPWATELIGQVREAARDMNAKPTTTFSSAEGDPLLIEKSNMELCNYVEACSMEGEDIVIKVKGQRARLHVVDVKNKYVIRQMSDETFRSIVNFVPELFDENFASLAAFLNQIKTSKE